MGAGGRRVDRLIGSDYALGGFERPARFAQSRGVAGHDPHGVITLRGSGSIDQFLRRAVTRIEELGLEVLSVIDFSGDAAEAGVAIPETKLVLFGNPRDLAELVRVHPRLAIELPLKVLMRETDDGQVLVSYYRPDDLALRYDLTEREIDTFRVSDAIARPSRRT